MALSDEAWTWLNSVRQFYLHLCCTISYSYSVYEGRYLCMVQYRQTNSNRVERFSMPSFRLGLVGGAKSQVLHGGKQMYVDVKSRF